MSTYIAQMEYNLALANGYAMFYGNDDAWLNAKAKNYKKVMPRGKVFNRILVREFRRTKLFAVTHTFRVSEGDRKIIKDGGWIESE